MSHTLEKGDLMQLRYALFRVRQNLILDSQNPFCQAADCIMGRTAQADVERYFLQLH